MISFKDKIRNAMRASIVNGEFKAGVLRNIIGTNTYWKLCDSFEGGEQAFIKAAQKYVDERMVVA
jgi:hypothetical protein